MFGFSSRDEFDLWRFLEGELGGDSLLDMVPKISPRYLRPTHLKPIADAFASARHGQRFITIDVPPRMGKTDMIGHGIPWRMLMDWGQQIEVAYISYAADLAHAKSKKMQEIAQRAGIPLRPNQAGAEWFTHLGSVVRATGIGGPIMGQGADLLIIDDPFKNREEAESQVIRDKVWDWFRGVAMSRLMPGASVIVVHQRLHDDDLIGRILDGQAGPGWEHISLPAIIDEDTPLRRSLWPEFWTLSELDVKRRLVGEYDWASMYMGMPRPRGGRLFREPARYTHHNEEGAFYIIGADPAATEKTTADYSVAVVMANKGRPGTIDQRVEIVDVVRMQCTVPRFAKELRRLALEWKAVVAVEAVGGFKAVPQMLRELDRGLRILEMHPTTDKFIRAQPVAAAWNDQRVSVPRTGTAPWVKPFVDEVTKFTGVKDAKDDQVDALAHGFNALSLALPQVRGVRSPLWRA